MRCEREKAKREKRRAHGHDFLEAISSDPLLYLRLEDAGNLRSMFHKNNDRGNMAKFKRGTEGSLAF